MQVTNPNQVDAKPEIFCKLLIYALEILLLAFTPAEVHGKAYGEHPKGAERTCRARIW
jgi:hypothetical protein